MRAARRTKLALLGALGVVVAALVVSSVLVLAARTAAPTGPQWQPAGLQGRLVHALAPYRGGLIAGTHGGVYRESNGRWTRILASGDVWGLTVTDAGQGIVAADNNGTADISSNAGLTWNRVMVSPGGAYAASHVPGGSHLLLGAVGGVFTSADHGLHWHQRLKLTHSAVDAFAWLPGSRTTVFAGAVVDASSGSAGVFVSRDAGQTWKPFGRNLRSTGGIMSVLAIGNRALFGGTMGNAAWRSGIATGIWRKAAIGMPRTGDHVASMALVPGPRVKLYAGTLGFGVFRSTDGGRSWTSISSGLPAPNGQIVLSVLYDRRDHALYAGTSDGVYRLPV
ncbi:MAG: WD40/YVTN/BNR-like repeat-containing protein [Chloroflexota bacterium]